jgi:peptidoglycan/xylan/chitin deacetylase (PgdA/CDA1 family)
MRGKREALTRIAAGIGFTRLLESMPKRPILTILNYHRIGNALDTPYDSGTFSATALEFDWQIDYLKRRYRVLTLQEALALTAGAKLTEPAVLITFDDGYIDNYQVAFPVLRRHGAQAVFFLPTAFIGAERIPWWDVIAYVVKRSKTTRISLSYPENKIFDLERDGERRTIMLILRLYKQPAMQDHDRFLEDLERACESSRPRADAQRCFLNWDEAREMTRHGMAFGSHTHSHELLSKLSAERQQDELARSREIIERELRVNIDTLAYPVGARHTFTPTTVEMARKTGYRAAFSFYGGFNKPGTIQPFDICRQGIDGQSLPRFRLQTSLGYATARHWF